MSDRIPGRIARYLIGPEVAPVCRVTDIPMAEIVKVMLSINLPGLVSHSTNVVEHPELVAARIARFASGVGPENVTASTDCGLGGRIHPHGAWAKLESLAPGAELAARELFRRLAA